MGHDQRGSLKDYWSREVQYCTPFYSNVTACDRLGYTYDMGVYLGKQRQQLK